VEEEKEGTGTIGVDEPEKEPGIRLGGKKGVHFPPSKKRDLIAWEGRRFPRRKKNRVGGGKASGNLETLRLIKGEESAPRKSSAGTNKGGQSL